MPGLDDRLRRGLEALAGGGEGSFEDVARRKGRARFRRRAQAATLALAVLAGTTGGVVALTRAFGLREGRPAGPAAGSLIAFVSNRDGDDEIYVMSDDGTGIRNLTRHPANDRDPAWSPDGSMIAFASNRHGGRATSIYVMRSDGRGVRRVTRGTDERPTWSPDGRSILFHRLSRTEQGVFEIAPTGGRPTRFAPSGSGFEPPTWSPDGRTLLFVETVHLRMVGESFPSSCFARFQGHTPGLFAQDLGSGDRHLIAGGNCISNAAWSTQDRIMFTGVTVVSAGLPTDDLGTRTMLVLVDPDGSRHTELVFPCDVVHDCRYPYVSGADWSPDGGRAVLGIGDPMNSALYAIRDDGSGWQRLTQLGWNASDPDWQHLPSPSPVPGPRPTASVVSVSHEICGDAPFPQCDWVVDVVRAAGWRDRHNSSSSITARRGGGVAPVTIRAATRGAGQPTDGSRCDAPYVRALEVAFTSVCAEGDAYAWVTAEYLVSVETAASAEELVPLVEASLALAQGCPPWGPVPRATLGTLTGDVDGDGAADEVVLERVPGSAPWCPYWLRVGEAIAEVRPNEGDVLTPEVSLVGLREIDERPGLEVVAQTGSTASSRLLRMFAWANPPPEMRIAGAGATLEVGKIRDGEVLFRGVDCAGEDHGTIVVGELIRGEDGSIVLRRRFFEAASDAFRLQPAVTRRIPVADATDRAALAREFPELRDEPFSSCARS